MSRKKLGVLSSSEFAAVWKARHDALLKAIQRMDARKDITQYKRIWKPKTPVKAHTRAGHYAIVPIRRQK